MLHSFFIGEYMADLVTIDEYKAFASIEGKNKDPQIATLITMCSRLVQDYIGYEVAQKDQQKQIIRTRKGITDYFIDIADPQVTDVYYRRFGAPANTEVGLVKETYEVTSSGLLRLFSLVPGDNDIIEVFYNQPDKTTEAIKLATMLLVKYYYKEEFNKTGIGAGGQTISYQTGKNFPPQVRAILMMYRMF